MNPVGKLFIAGHVALYRATGGKMGSRMAGGKVLLLTTKGRTSGKPRTVPVMYFGDGADRVVIASAGGSAAHPAWFKNLDRHPDVTVEVDGERYAACAAVATGEERARIWKDVTSVQPRFTGYEQKAKGREIPVVVLKKA
jgi:deazaflavin-dependent oxidoreductase (nitroreductase family)